MSDDAWNHRRASTWATTGRRAGACAIDPRLSGRRAGRRARGRRSGGAARSGVRARARDARPANLPPSPRQARDPRPVDDPISRAREKNQPPLRMSRFARASRPGITHLRHGERGAVENRGAHGVSAGLHDTLHCCFRGRCDAECERAGIRRASQARVFDAKRESPSSVGHTF